MADNNFDPSGFDLSSILTPPAPQSPRPQSPQPAKAKHPVMAQMAVAAVMPLIARQGPVAVSAFLNGFQRAQAQQLAGQDQANQRQFENQRQVENDQRLQQTTDANEMFVIDKEDGPQGRGYSGYLTRSGGYTGS